MALFTITLDDYEVANLQSLFRVLHGSRLDTGDWCGQMRWKLDDLKPCQGPNVDEQGMRQRLEDKR
jgi:hypothetical protein